MKLIPNSWLVTKMAERLHHFLFLLLSSLKLTVLGVNSLADDLVPSGLFRDDIIFDISWPGSLEPDPLTSNTLPEGGEAESNIATAEGRAGAVGLLDKMSNHLFSEVDYNEMKAMDLKTADNEEYRCVVPQLTNLNDKEVGNSD